MEEIPMFEMPKLPYAEDALEPYISSETISYHYGKHTKKYFDTTNELIKGTVFEKKVKTLDDLINKEGLLKVDSTLFNNACQAWNHAFYWNCLVPKDQSGKPSGAFQKECDRLFDNTENMQELFNAKATKHFGSGWAWLVVKRGELQIKITPNCATPLTEPDCTPLLVCDIWEHSWYLQYPADKPAYLKAFWNIVNWDLVNERYERATAE
jgi:Fe-Mn family superoxide dismutase